MRALASRIKVLAEKASKRVGEPIKIMNFCGTHEYTITYYGLRSLMPPQVELVAGPGCPVCVTPAWYIDAAVKLAIKGVRVYAYGDVFRLPGSTRGVGGARSLEEARAQGGDVRVVYSFRDALEEASRDGKESVFLAIGFETTVPSVASPLVRQAVPRNLRVLCAYRLTPPILSYVFKAHRENPIRGVIAPGHVSAIIGAGAWRFVAEEHGIPVVVAGFEPLDVMLAVAEILRQLSLGETRLFNEYSRVVSWEGNPRAKSVMNECFRIDDAWWRGIGLVPRSGLKLRTEYSEYDAELYYRDELKSITSRDELPVGCRCGEVVLGLARPVDCPFFMKRCTPENPYGPCMVSSEGSCSIWARFGGGGLAEELARSLGLLE